MEPVTDVAKGRWGQVRRLAFIDLRLQFEGRLRRADLTDFFRISVPQASQDLSDYKELAGGTVAYDPGSKYTIALEAFKPVFQQTTATLYLDEIHRLATGVVPADASFVGFSPPTGIVATPARALNATEVAKFVAAIRDKTCLEVEYHSMSSPKSTRRVLAPHAFGFDGLRWHVRAYCFTRQAFRDFAIGRMRNVQPCTQEAVDPARDADWNSEVTIELVPHPALSASQRKAVMQDYAMRPEGLLKLKCRKAMVFYTLRHLNLGSPIISDDPARQHVVVKNRAEVDGWVNNGTPG